MRSVILLVAAFASLLGMAWVSEAYKPLQWGVLIGITGSYLWWQSQVGSRQGGNHLSTWVENGSLGILALVLAGWVIYWD